MRKCKIKYNCIQNSKKEATVKMDAKIVAENVLNYVMTSKMFQRSFWSE
jgi:hypothetical protein